MSHKSCTLTKKWGGYKKGSVLRVLKPGKDPKRGYVTRQRAELLVKGKLASWPDPPPSKPTPPAEAPKASPKKKPAGKKASKKPKASKRRAR